MSRRRSSLKRQSVRRFEQRRIAWQRAQARRTLRVVLKLDFRAFQEGMRKAAEAFAEFGRRLAAALPECAADDCTKKAMHVLSNGERVCPHHFIVGTGRGIPEGLLIGMPPKQRFLARAAAREANDFDRAMRSALSASGGVSSIPPHESEPDTPPLDRPRDLRRDPDPDRSARRPVRD